MMSSAENSLENFTRDELFSVSASLQSVNTVLTSEVTSLKSENTRLRIERDHFKAQYEGKLRALYAATSEARHNPDQQDILFNEAEDLAGAAPQTEVAEVAEATDDSIVVAAHTKKKPGRKPLNAALPREIVRIELPADERICAHDGATLVEIGVVASEKLDIVPMKIKVIRTERVKYACPCCDNSIKTSPAPLQLLPKGSFTPNAMAWIIISKYQDALPLYRQANILARCDGDIARNTLAGTVVRVGEAVQPLINMMQEYWLAADIKHMDETVVQVLKEPGRKAQSQSYFWLRASNSGPPIRVFNYAPSRSGKTASDLLDGARGVLLTDGYEAYNKPAQLHNLVHLGCWVHARRYFIKAEETLPRKQRGKEHPASQMIALIGALYGVEKHADDLQFSDAQRGELRREKSCVLLEQINTLRHQLLATTLPKSVLGEALHYLHKQWPKLVRFTDNGAWPLDNNVAENAIRPFVIGRKNWLFSDTVHGARASANLYSLIETAKANGLEPYHYLAHVFAELPKAQTAEHIEALLPWNIRLV